MKKEALSGEERRYGYSFKAIRGGDREESLKYHLTESMRGVENWIAVFAVRKRLTNIEYLRLLIEADISRREYPEVEKAEEIHIKSELEGWWGVYDSS